jgi:DNA-binding transcriptional regulator YiaG
MTIIKSMDKDELKEWRQRNGYSQSDLAEALGISTLTVSRWERGAKNMPPYLHITLKCLKKKGGEVRKAGRPPKKTAAQKKEKEVKERGKRSI